MPEVLKILGSAGLVIGCSIIFAGCSHPQFYAVERDREGNLLLVPDDGRNENLVYVGFSIGSPPPVAEEERAKELRRKRCPKDDPLCMHLNVIVVCKGSDCNPTHPRPGDPPDFRVNSLAKTFGEGKYLWLEAAP